MNKHFMCKLTALPLVKAKVVAELWVVLLGGEFSQQTNQRAGQLGFGTFQHAIVLLLVILLHSSQMTVVASNGQCLKLYN